MFTLKTYLFFFAFNALKYMNFGVTRLQRIQSEVFTASRGVERETSFDEIRCEILAFLSNFRTNDAAATSA